MNQHTINKLTKNFTELQHQDLSKIAWAIKKLEGHPEQTVHHFLEAIQYIQLGLTPDLIKRLALISQNFEDKP